jgi:hypothetical protein
LHVTVGSVRAVTLALVVALVAVAAPASARTDEWKAHTVAKSGLAVSAPDTWIDVTRLSPQLLQKMKEIPSLAAYAGLAKQSKAVKLVLVDAGAASVRNHYATNMNVVVVPSPADLRLLRDASVAQLRSTGIVVGTVAARYVTLPAGRAVQLRYQARYTPTTPVVSLLQYLVIHKGNSVVVTYTTLPKLRSAYAPVFARSARSLRLS